MITYSVYAHKHKDSGKTYIGITLQNPKDRWENRMAYTKTSHFGRAIAKYGWDAFEHVIIVSGVSEEAAKEIERSLIATFELTNPDKGYNEAAGGGGGGFLGHHHTKDARRRISEKLKVHEFTETHRKRISEAKGGIKHHFAKTVYQYTKDGNLVGKWPYMNMAANALNICKESISACCKGKRPTAGGYIWTYNEKG